MKPVFFPQLVSPSAQEMITPALQNKLFDLIESYQAIHHQMDAWQFFILKQVCEGNQNVTQISHSQYLLGQEKTDVHVHNEPLPVHLVEACIIALDIGGVLSLTNELIPPDSRESFITTI
ncbi:hypothetical protein H6F38_21975 [Paenibacillus sp. EKM208P]|nr:hypothetical protein H6F38_21975 [Paenibacillus sp. EKM208P]